MGVAPDLRWPLTLTFDDLWPPSIKKISDGNHFHFDVSSEATESILLISGTLIVDDRKVVRQKMAPTATLSNGINVIWCSPNTFFYEGEPQNLDEDEDTLTFRVYSRWL